MQKNIHSSLKKLNLAELNTMLKHVRLGKEHLRKSLKEKRFTQLLKLSPIQPEHKNKLETDLQEKSGNIALVLNVVVTSILGSWLGFAGFVGLSLHSVIALVIIVILLMGTCGWVGFISFKLTKKQARESLVDKKLRLLELAILEHIYQQREKVLQKVRHDINQVLSQFIPHWDRSKQKMLANAIDAESGHSNAYEILELFILENISLEQANLLHPIIHEKITDILKQLKNIALKLAKHQEHLALHPQPESGTESNKTFLVNRSLTGANTYIRILTTPGIEHERAIITPHKWVRSNMIALLTGLAPTLLGSFASMFVFLTGIPDILQAFHVDIKTIIHNQVAIQITGISIASMLTIYYCYSYIHSNYKNYLRDKEIEKTEHEIAKESDLVSRLALKTDLLTDIKNLLGELAFIHTVLQTCPLQGKGKK